jgi:hypothetical protein
MVVGFNYPWSCNRFAWDFGPRLRDPDGKVVTSATFRMEQQMALQGRVSALPLPPIFQYLGRNLAILKKMRIQVVRIWLVASGLLYGTAPVKRSDWSDNKGGTQIANYDWDYTVPPRADPRFAYQFGQLLSQFKGAGLQVIPSLLDFSWGGNSSADPAFGPLGIAPGGRSDCFKDSGKMDLLLGTLLTELLAVAAAQEYSGVVYAFEVINEPLWNIEPSGALGLRRPEVTVDQMNQFLYQACTVIEGYGLESTIGHRRYQDIGIPASVIAPVNPPTFRVAGTKPQFHYYAKHAAGFGDPSQIAGSGLFPNTSRKPFLGEFDSALNRHGNPWPELAGHDTTAERLRLLEAQGCELALIWPELGGADEGKLDDAERGAENRLIDDNDPVKLSWPTRLEIASYTGGTATGDDLDASALPKEMQQLLRANGITPQ